MTKHIGTGKRQANETCLITDLLLARVFRHDFLFKVVTGRDLTATVMLLTLFQGNVILSLFRDLFKIEPPESGTP